MKRYRQREPDEPGSPHFGQEGSPIMIIVTDAGLKVGYTGCDHLINSTDSDNVRAVVGRQFRSVGEARRAAERAYASACDYRVAFAPVWLTVKLASGEVRNY